MIKVITFDIDTTLTHEVSWYLLTEQLGADPKTHREIFNDYLADKITYPVAKSRLIKLWQNTGNCNKVFFEKIFQNTKLKNDTKDIINYFQSKGILICLITGSVDVYAEIISKRLGIENYYFNTKLIWNENNDLVDFDYDKNQGALKLNQFKEFCLINNISLKEAYVVGDDENDIELFKYTKHGIAVKSPSSHKVEKYAWKVIKNLTELKFLF